MRSTRPLYKRPLYNAATDFAPVALIAQVPLVLITRKDFPARDLAQFIAYAKAQQSHMQFGSAGAGTSTHIGCVLLNQVIGRRRRPCALSGRRGGAARRDGRASESTSFTASVVRR